VADEVEVEVERVVETYRVRYASCDTCECVTMIQRNDDRGVPDESEWEEFGQCLVCGGSLHGWDADEKSVDDSYWAMGRQAGIHRILAQIPEVLRDGDQVVPFVDVREEYGVQEDRRAKGLGVALLGVYSTRSLAEHWADKRRGVSDNPIRIKIRLSAITEWRELPEDGVAGD
jgi:hypothetical protein